MKILKALSLTLLMALGGASTQALAKQDTESQMAVIDALITAAGYTDAFDEDYDELAQGDVNRSNYTLTAGRTYKFVAVCDADCNDVDIVIYDRNGNWVDADVEDDATPIVDITAEYSGKYEVQTKMRNCSTSTCYYRTRGYRQD